MAKEHLSPRNAQRLRVIDTYRGLARRHANLFLTYSIKMDRDWMISGDRPFVHWIYYLETDPDVKAFDFTSEFSRDNDHLWVVDVVLANGSRIIHQVGRSVEENRKEIEQQNELSPNSISRLKNRTFTDENLQPVVKVCLRWLKPIGFATALRDHEYPHQTLALLEYFKQHKNGQIGQILEQPYLCEHDPAQALGLIVRLAIRGHIKLDLGSNSFGYCTPWIMLEGG